MDDTNETEERNALIESATLELERGVLTSWLHLSWDGGGQGFGGYVLAVGTPPGPHCGIWVREVLRVVGVDSWKDLPGRIVRIRHTPDKVHAIGHPLRELWFEPALAFGRLP